MELLGVVSLIIGLIILYFLFGTILKFFLGWFPIIITVIIGLIIGLQGGIAGAVIGIFLVLIGVFLTDSWQGNKVFLFLEEKIDNIFYFND